MVNLLFCDDDPIRRHAISEICLEEGLQATIVATPSDALKEAQSQSYSFIFLDITNVHGDVMSLPTQIKLLRPDVFVVGYSGYPKYMLSEDAHYFDEVASSRDFLMFGKIREFLEKLGSK